VAVLHANGFDLAEVSRLAGEADVVLVVAGSRHDEVGEYISDEQGLRPNGPEQKKPLTIKRLKVIEAAAKANKRCIVALVGGSVFTMEEWKNDVPAVLMAWYFGMEGGHALARVLFGEVNPSAKMPLTTPKDESQLPFFDKEKREPAFPFGHGLSYTTYAYKNLTTKDGESGDQDGGEERLCCAWLCLGW